MRNLFVCAIGPVQDFIATARRSRDLWYGSWMLSELSKAAAKKINDEFPDSLVFPYAEKPGDLAPESNMNVPNKIVAIIDGDPGWLGNEVRQAIHSRMESLWKDARRRITGPLDDNLAQKQIEGLVEFYWVSVPFSNDQEYPRVRSQAEALLSSRKATRDFLQVEGQHLPKSSLDGARESVIPETEYPMQNDPKKIDKITSLYEHYHARQGERLSAVDLLKRMGEPAQEPDFKSTSHMAAIPFMQSLGSVQSKALIAEIRGFFTSKKGYIGERDDGSLLYESRLTDWLPAGTDQDMLRKALTNILRDYAGEARPSPYYALLAADGDNMGVVIDAQTDYATHRNLSRALSKFASKVPGIVKQRQGVLVYAGGDDVLAYLPIYSVLECAKILAEEFRKNLEDFTVQKDGQLISPTLSVGIVIAHHIEPLSDVLELARNAEREAKRVDGKNSLAVTLSKRGGVNRTVCGKWGIIDQRLSQLIAFAKANEISTGIAYELQGLHQILSKTAIPDEGVADEALRIIGRKRQSGGTTKVSPQVKAVYKQWLSPDPNETEKRSSKIALDELAREIIVAGMLAGNLQSVESSLEVS